MSLLCPRGAGRCYGRIGHSSLVPSSYEGEGGRSFNREYRRSSPSARSAGTSPEAGEEHEGDGVLGFAKPRVEIACRYPFKARSRW